LRWVIQLPKPASSTGLLKRGRTYWEAQYDFSEFVTLGSELYYHTAATNEDKETTGFTIGGSLNFTEHIHLIFSGGHSIVNENLATAYFGLYITSDSKMCELCKYFLKLYNTNNK